MVEYKLDQIYGAIADPTRRAILAVLATGDANVGSLVDRFPISFNGVSKHVKVLERSGLVERTIRGREHWLHLNARPLSEAARWLEHYRAFWNTRLDALESFLVGKKKGDVSEAGNVLVVRRLIPVPRDEVFAAWLDPASLALWMRPGTVTKATVEVDARVGGRFRIVMMHGRGGHEHWGEYLTIEPPSRLSFTWISANTDLRPTVVTVEFFERGSSTELILTHEGLPAARVDEHKNGWTDIIAKLGETLRAP